MTSSPATLSYTAAPHNVTVRVSLPSRLLNYTEITVQSLEVMGTGESTDAGALTVRPHAAVRLLVRGSGLEARMRLTLEVPDAALWARASHAKAHGRGYGAGKWGGGYSPSPPTLRER